MSAWGAGGALGGRTAPRAGVVAAFLAVYGIWGSTYLAIAVAVESLPPLLMVSLRCLTAGAVLVGWARLRGDAWPGSRSWLVAASRATLLFGAYGLVAWAEQRVASGIAAVLVASSALFVLLLDGRSRRHVGAKVGIGLGLAGILLMAAPWHARTGADLAGMAALVGSAILWAAGSAWSRARAVPGSTLMSAALELLAGSALTLVAGLALGEASAVHPGAISLRSILALAYLIVFGSVVAYTAFRWLLDVSSPTLVATHAYVNPVIALALGWLLHGEALTGSMVAAAGMVLGGVALVAGAAH